MAVDLKFFTELMGLLGKPLVSFSQGFFKSCLKLENLWLEMIKSASFVNVFSSSLGSVLLEILSTDISKPIGSLWLFMGKRQLGQRLLKCVENTPRRSKNYKKLLKSSCPFYDSKYRYKIFQYILQSLKVYLWAVFPVVPHTR